jgi:dihydroorotase
VDKKMKEENGGKKTDQSSSVLVLKSGRVIDPENGINGVLDVVLNNGKIQKLQKDVSPPEGSMVIDVDGMYVTPGLVDIHTHLFATTGIRDAWAGDYSVLPDGFSFRTGVTTMVDAGSAGWKNFDTFRHTVIDRVKTRVFAFLNIANLVMVSEANEQDEADFMPDHVCETVSKHSDVIVGVKAAHYKAPDWTQIDRALEAGEKASLPVMVDFGHFRRERPYWKLVAERLRAGDISTHCFRGSIPFVDEKGRLYRYLRDARTKGVLFDVGHGEGSFLFRNAIPAMRNNFYPDTISTDLHVLSMNSFMMDMPTTMSKFLAMGMSLEETVLRSTALPARAAGHPELGQLRPGAHGDIAVWNLLEGNFAFGDARGGRIPGNRRFFCELTIKEGQIVWDWNALSAVPYEKLGQTYGNREGVDFLVLPDE